MTTEILVTAVGILLATAVSAAAFLSASRARRATAEASKSAVDAGAYGRAKEIYDSAIDQLQASVAELRAEINRLRSQAADLSGEITRLRATNEELRAEVATLRRAARKEP